MTTGQVEIIQPGDCEEFVSIRRKRCGKNWIGTRDVGGRSHWCDLMSSDSDILGYVESCVNDFRHFYRRGWWKLHKFGSSISGSMEIEGSTKTLDVWKAFRKISASNILPQVSFVGNISTLASKKTGKLNQIIDSKVTAWMWYVHRFQEGYLLKEAEYLSFANPKNLLNSLILR